MQVIRALVLAALVTAWGSSAQAQSDAPRTYPPALLLSAGFASVDQHDTRCEANVNLLGAIEAQTGGIVFVALSAEGLGGVPTSDCLPAARVHTQPDNSVIITRDRLYIEGGSLFSAGVGTRTYPLEIIARVGVARGQDGYESRAMPVLDAQGRLYAGPFMLAVGSRWIRNPRWQVRYAPGEWDGLAVFDRPENAETVWHWSRATTFNLGLRFRF